MLDDGAAEPAGEDAGEFGAPLVGAHAARVRPRVRFDVGVVIHGHHGDPAKRGPSVMSYDVFGRVLREVVACGSRIALGRRRRSGVELQTSDFDRSLLGQAAR